MGSGTDESTPFNEEDINAFSVGCEGMLGRVGEGSRSLSCGEPLLLWSVALLFPLRDEVL